MRRTRIVATIGPATSSQDQIDRLVAAGMDVARLNFSHGTHEQHAAFIERVRAAEERSHRPIAILQDLQGPKLRLGTFGVTGGGRVDLQAGASFTLTPERVVGTSERASVTAPDYLRDMRPGDQVWLADGLIQLEVQAIESGAVRCRVIVGGRLGDHTGVSVPRLPASVACLTDKDRDDLRFGLQHGVDFVAVSFVRSAADIGEVRTFLHQHAADVPIIAKIERHEAVRNLAGLLTIADAVMVARGDLGIDVPLEEVPHIQKDVIRQARDAKVPVIVATQMLESMVDNPRPTRAEVSDVSTAIFDGTDAIMLSGETATGQYPIESVTVMARIAERAEEATLRLPVPRRRAEVLGFPEALADAAATAAHALKARAIVAFTQSGFSARLISQERPVVPIIALTPFVSVQRRLGLSWGVSSRLIKKVETTDEMVEEVEATLLGDGSVRLDDILVIISGAPMWVTGTTNLLKLHRVGERR